MVEEECGLVVEEVLSENQINHILKQSIGDDVSWVYKGVEINPAMDGLAGFLGDHMKVVLHVDVGEELKKIHLFLKRIPKHNPPKAEFLDKHNFFRREKLMFQLLQEICDGNYDADPWAIKAYIFTDSMIVMPDITFEEYKTPFYLDTLDLQHVLLTTKSMARFHAAFVNYETKKAMNLCRPYSILQEFGHILSESTFRDSPWLRASSKLSASLIRKFSTKFGGNLPDLESKLTKLYIEACDSLTEYKYTANSLLHKDLWVKNIMFKYNNNTATNALLIDYQCLRYGPPAFDLMVLLYLSTNKSFRNANEKVIFDHYYDIFVQNLTSDSVERLQLLGYDKNNFVMWCEKARMFGLFVAIGIYPFVLMDAKTAQKTYDDPETFDKHLFEDRSEPVINYAMKCEGFRLRNMEVTEEFVERYLSK